MRPAQWTREAPLVEGEERVRVLIAGRELLDPLAPRDRRKVVETSSLVVPPVTDLPAGDRPGIATPWGNVGEGTAPETLAADREASPVPPGTERVVGLEQRRVPTVQHRHRVLVRVDQAPRVRVDEIEPGPIEEHLPRQVGGIVIR
jgi:hypothetical protein